MLLSFVVAGTFLFVTSSTCVHQYSGTFVSFSRFVIQTLKIRIGVLLSIKIVVII